jgi:drug/metabolite transporter (DMT)-like permease
LRFGLTWRGVPEKKNNFAIGGGLLLAVTLWGGNNAGTKWLLASWPPIATGSTRFLAAGLILLAGARVFSRVAPEKISGTVWRALWLRGGLSLAAYILFYALALRRIPVSHIALYLGASPVWALLWEGRPRWNFISAQRYGAALLALAGVFILFAPALRHGQSNLAGEILGLFASFTWAFYSRQSRFLVVDVDGIRVAAHSMWMAGVWLLPWGILEVATRTIPLDTAHVGVQVFCILFGSVVPYAFWNSALGQWRTSRVMLFNNFIPLTTTLWAYFLLREPITPTFCAAMILIVAAVLFGQTEWQKFFKLPDEV